MNVTARGAGTWTQQAQQQAPRHKRAQLIAGAILLGGFLLFSVFRFGVAEGSAPLLQKQQTIETQQHAITHLTQETHHLIAILHKPCQDDSVDQLRLKQLVARGAYREAAAVAELVLTSERKLCLPTTTALATLWQTASLDALQSTPALSPLDQTPILSYQEIIDKSQQFGITPPDPLATFSLMYQAGVWQLARFAYIQAKEQGLVSTSDVQSIAKYVATLRNQGHALAFHYQGFDRATGERLLATCAAIAHHLALQSGECAADLTQLLGPKWSAVVPPLPDPVLNTLSASNRAP